MQDYLQDCITDFQQKGNLTAAVAPSEFRELFCSKCANRDCMNRQSGDPMAARLATQFDRLMNPTRGNPGDPRYAQIVGANWEDMTREALKLVISGRRNDWTVPVIGDTAPKPLPVKAAEPVLDEDDEDEGNDGGDEGGGTPLELPSPPKPPAPLHPKKNPTFRPETRGNAQIQGGMIGGAPLPEPKKAPPPIDPWAAPVPASTSDHKISSGAVIKLGAGGYIIDE